MIIRVYNTDNILNKMVKSAQNQNIKDIEIILFLANPLLKLLLLIFINCFINIKRFLI